MVEASDNRRQQSQEILAIRLAAKALLAFLFFATFATGLRAQTVQIKLVNGKTGRPITHRSKLTVRVGHEHQSNLLIPTGKHGVALLQLTRNDSEINIPDCRDEQADWEKLQKNRNQKDEKEFNNKYKDCNYSEVNNPIARYADSISVQMLPGAIVPQTASGRVVSAGYVPCWLDSNQDKYSWTRFTDFSTKDILQHGIVTANTCGKATASPEPGQLVLFVREPTVGEQWRQAWY